VCPHVCQVFVHLCATVCARECVCVQCVRACMYSVFAPMCVRCVCICVRRCVRMIVCVCSLCACKRGEGVFNMCACVWPHTCMCMLVLVVVAYRESVCVQCVGACM
jgi:hypothetical protein